MRLTHSEDFYIRALFKKTKIQEVMTTPVVVIRADEPFHKVVELMAGKKIRHLPIVNEQGQLVGLLSERDVFRIQPPRKLEDGRWYYEKEALAQIKLSQVMVPNPVTLKPEDSLAAAVEVMVKGKYGCIPVVDNKEILCGIVTQFDFLKLAAEILHE